LARCGIRGDFGFGGKKSGNGPKVTNLGNGYSLRECCKLIPDSQSVSIRNLSTHAAIAATEKIRAIAILD
jgi:hypothetical protein